MSERFGGNSPERSVQTQELLDFVDWAKRAGVRRIIINGSYVTSKIAPNDVDIIILPGANYPQNERRCTDEESTWPFLQIVVAADDEDLETWALKDFGTDRNQLSKGVVELKL